MLRHVVLIKLTEDATDSDRQAILDGLGSLPGIIPEIRSYSFGFDAGISAGNVELAIVGDFDDEAAYSTYATHDDHVAVIEQYIKPFVAQRTAVQFAVA